MSKKSATRAKCSTGEPLISHLDLLQAVSPDSGCTACWDNATWKWLVGMQFGETGTGG